MTDKQAFSIASIEESSDNVWSIEMTANEIRQMLDTDMFSDEDAINGKLYDAFDDVQGHVFGGANPVAYLIIKVTHGE